MKGTVKWIKVTESGNLVTLNVTEPPPPPDTVDYADVPDKFLRQFQTAQAGGLPVEWTPEGTVVKEVTVG